MGYSIFKCYNAKIYFIAHSINEELLLWKVLYLTVIKKPIKKIDHRNVGTESETLLMPKLVTQFNSDAG
jgi:hypothetical protein